MKVIRALLVLLLLLVIAASVAVHWIGSYYHEPIGGLEGKTVIVEKGSSIGQIARKMSADGVIRYPQVFTLMARYENKVNPKFGEYFFTPDMRPADILNKLEKGETVVRKVVVPEGKTVLEIYDIISHSDKLKITLTPDDLPPEGSLMPSTYLYSYGDSDRDIINKMQADMKTVVDKLWETRAADLPVKTKEEALILASIVEKETGIDGERGLVASVFTNRLNKGMKLESDPTAVYGITKGATLGRKPTAADIDQVNDYNTYIIPALPPTPICNPGVATIAAVLNPPKTEYLFFVANGTGGHNFAATYEEHVQNIKLLRDYLKNQPN